MAIPGTKPKANSRNRNKPVHDWTEVVNEPYADAPKLPKAQPDGRPWPTWTRRWWGVVSSMPHCSLWTDADWEFAYDTAALKATFHSEGGTGLATEIRNREKVLGTTADYRRDLRIRYVEQPEEPGDDAAEVTKLADYRDAF